MPDPNNEFGEYGILQPNSFGQAPLEGVLPGGIVPEQQLAADYSDSLLLKFCNAREINNGRDPLEPYRNNLTTFSDQSGIYFVAMGSWLTMFEWDPVKNTPQGVPVGRLRTAPRITTVAHVNGANWSASPHGINFIKIGTLLGRELVILACDNGQILGWETNALRNAIAQGERGLITTEPAFIIRGHCSAWGVDTLDEQGLLAYSDNTRKVTIVDIKPLLLHTDEECKQWVSPTLGHNIPDVQFIQPDTPVEDKVYLSCVGIDCEVACWEFDLGAVNIEVNEPHDRGEDDDDGWAEPGDVFKNGKWIYHDSIDEAGWTITALYEPDFKQVASLGEALGNLCITQEPLFSHFRQENKKLNVETESYYPSCRFSYHEIKTNLLKSAAADLVQYSAELRNHLLTCVQMKGLKRKQFLNSNESHLHTPLFKNSFVFCTTKKAVILSRAEDFCVNASRIDVFGWTLFDSVAVDRMSLVTVIRDLSAIAVASQVGVVSIFRMVRFNGVYCVRQEYVFPETHDSVIRSERILVGLTARRIKSSHYQLILLFHDHTTLTYDICSTGEHHDLENIVL